MLNLSGGTT